MNRVRAAYCTVPNPFNQQQVSYVSLKPEDVDVLVFWTRNPRPLFPFLQELDQRGYRYYFLYTLMDNPYLLDPHCPQTAVSLKTFCELSDRIGPSRMVWRYDPIVLSSLTDAAFHQATFERIARALRGFTCRSVFSTVALYRKVGSRLRQLRERGMELAEVEYCPGGQLDALMRAMAGIAAENGMEIASCAATMDLRPYGISPSKCIDDEHILKTFGVRVTGKKDPSQRPACGCVVSKDIGMYDSCLYGCIYCYATKSLEQARKNHTQHDPHSPSLLGWHDAPLPNPETTSF
jgi:hypothetical protein